jgi:hypothetical protein
MMKLNTRALLLGIWPSSKQFALRGQIKWVNSTPPRGVKHWIASFGSNFGSGFETSTTISPARQYAKFNLDLPATPTSTILNHWMVHVT